jgi:puromycin-sensitive aminopeptidase
VIEECRRLFASDHGAGEAIDPDLVTSVLAVVTSHATRAEFDQILERHRQPLSPIDEIRHLYCLAGLSDTEFAAHVLELCRTEVRSQNAPYLLSSMLRSRSIGALTWNFVTNHFDELVARFPSNSIHRMLDGVASLVAAPGDADFPSPATIREFCVSHIEPARRRLVEQSLERLDVNTAFALREQPAIAALLA